MNPSLDRKLERLAREIAAAKAPRLDAAANAQFKQLSQSHSSKTGADWNAKDGTKRTLFEDNGAAQKFNVGDRVRVIFGQEFFGATGTVRQIGGDGWLTIRVAHDGEEDVIGNWRCWAPKHLELVTQ